jgi:hypothetical protein
MKLNPKQLIERSRKAFADRDANRQIFEDVDEFINPYKNTWGKEGNKTYNKPSRQFDSTAMHSAANFVSTVQSNFFPVFTRWAEFRAGPAYPEKNRKKINKDLALLTEIVFSYIDASNFNTAIAEMAFDWGKGTGAMWVHEGDAEQPLNFVTIPSSQLGLTEGKHGTVDGKFREYRIKARLIKATWARDKVKLSSELERLIKDKPDEEVTLIEATYWDDTELVWRYEVAHEASEHILLSRTYTEEPCLTPRWMKIPGFTHGIGPFVMAMADIKTLNRVKEYMLRSAALNIFGMYTVVNSGSFNPTSINLTPGVFIPVERNGGPNGPSISPLPTNGDFQMQEFMVRDLQDSIRKTLLDTRLPQDTPQPKTAFEIAQRIKEFQQDIGAAFGRGMYEFVQPLFKRIVSILQRKKLITLPENFEIDNFFVQVSVVSPIAKAQGVQDVQTFMQNYQMMQAISPEIAMMAYEVEKLPQWLSDKTGSDAKLLRDEADVQAMKQMLAQVLAAQQMQQQQGAQGGA